MSRPIRRFAAWSATLASLYDLQNPHRDELTYQSPTTAKPVGRSFLMADDGREAESSHPRRGNPRRAYVRSDGPDAGFLQCDGDRLRGRARLSRPP